MKTGKPIVTEPPRYKKTDDSIALCVIGRRENRYAREFVEHYKRLGFDKIFVCDNNHEGEEYFEDVLSDYIYEGFVEILNYRNLVGVQRQSYVDVYRRYGGKYRWIAFFDFDEFLTLVGCDNIHKLMPNYEEYDCVLFNWQNYGDNGYLRDNGLDLADRFFDPLPFDHIAQYEDIPDNDHVKCIVHGGLPLVEFDDSPHLPSNKMRCCNSLGDTCRQSPFQRYNFSVAYLKHYATKTVEEWYSNKWQKCTGNNINRVHFESRYANRFFIYNEWTQEKEDIMRECIGLPPKVAPSRKTVVVINFNTQKLTEAAIRSLNKHTPDCDVFVFDNSTKEPFVNTFDNVSVIDNTKGQYIDFESILAEYPDKYPTPENNYGSAKHCMTVDFCFDMFPDGFLLMDSDVLIKKDITSLFDASCAWVGKMELHHNRWNYLLPRVLPYICYFNVPLLSKYGIRYFNGEKMWALSHRHPDMWYDTGCWFYEACNEKSLPVYHTEINNYILHLKHGSWNATKSDEWLVKHKDLWE